jgi:GDPmannose 4,6-dehydratase
MKKILVTGVTGQIGWYVAEKLAQAGHQVFGMERQTTLGRPTDGRRPPFEPVLADLLDEYSLLSLVERIQPDEVYNFAAQSFIPASFQQPILTAQYTGIGVVRLLEALRRVAPRCRFLQAGSSELFASSGVSPQNERTPVTPRNPYGVAKAFAFHTVRVYREHYGMHAANAIFYTNESPRRSSAFLFRKVTRGVAAIRAGDTAPLTLGDLDARRDWGYTPEYADAAIRILSHGSGDDFVIATGEAHTVRELVERAFALVGLDWQRHVQVDPQLVRKSDPQVLVGDSRKARELLGWTPTVKFDGLVRTMLGHDLGEKGLALPIDAPHVSQA